MGVGLAPYSGLRRAPDPLIVDPLIVGGAHPKVLLGIGG
jgi:hypothetical protein